MWLLFVLSFDGSFIRFTQKNFLRVYPKGTRFNSSNYKPQVGWLHGAQMIAFNMQVRPESYGETFVLLSYLRNLFCHSDTSIMSSALKQCY